VGIIDAKGHAANFTGKKCFKWAGAKIGKNYTVQGNILASEKVVLQMAERFETTEGDLAERLVSALEGGEAAGGDARGRQSASLLVVRKKHGRASYGDRYIDLRVEDHPDPIRELRRLLGLQRVYLLISEGDEHIAKGDFRKARSTLQEALRFNPKSDDALIDLAIANMKLGNEVEAVRAFRKVLKFNPKMEHVLKQMPELTCGKGLEVLARLGLKPKTS
jgi:tetratricopeptide (TPR) repeat protein